MTTNLKHGQFSWNELMTTDLEGAKEFYAKVIGWTASDVAMADPMSPAVPGEPSYTMWLSGEEPRGGAMKMEGPEMAGIPPHWMCYVTVDDVDETAKKAVANGGKALVGPLEVKGIGRFYIIQDPQGAALGIATYEAAMTDNG